MRTIGTLAVGAICGVLSAFGIGGGSLLMVWMTAILSMHQQEAQSVNLLYFLPTAAAALLLHAKHRLIEWRVVIPAAACGCLAAVGCAMLAANADPRVLRKIFGGFLLLVGISELVRRTGE